MANLRDIRRRIRSVKNTAQITRAMQLVAASKMKKAQDQALAGRDYAENLNRILANLKDNVSPEAHALLDQREVKNELILIISTDKGLCGALNGNLAKVIHSEVSKETDVATAGRKLRQHFGKSGYTMVADFEVADPVTMADARAISKFLTEAFLSEKYDRVSIAFNHFVSTLTQEPTIHQLLPIQAESLGKEEQYGSDAEGTPESTAEDAATEYLFEPSAEHVLGTLLPLYVNFLVYQMLVENRASEHSSRMVAMKAATDNANDMIKDLTLQYNKLRQAAITSELLEITTAMKAME